MELYCEILGIFTVKWHVSSKSGADCVIKFQIYCNFTCRIIVRDLIPFLEISHSIKHGALLVIISQFFELEGFVRYVEKS